MNKPSEITFETEETIVVREDSTTVVYCAGCAKDVVMSTPRAAAVISGISERQIFRMLELDLLHFSEDGRVLICLESMRSFREEVVL